jgi:ankyrin repeat protein
MALFSSNLKKMQSELSNSDVDWGRLVSLSSGRCDLSGKNSVEGGRLISVLVRKAAETSGDEKLLTQIFRNIVSKGGDLNMALNSAGLTPLHIAAELSDSTLLKSLLQAGVQPASTTVSGATALHIAVASGHLENVKMLLAAGADSGAEDSTGNAPLHFAVQLKTPVNIVEVLLAAGAKAYHRNAQQKTSVHIAEEKGQRECVEILRESLKKYRKNSTRKWNCPKCGSPVQKPLKHKVDWYLSVDMWDYLQFTCGECGTVTSATALDGEI